MDAFRACQNAHTGLGGIKCPCCNLFTGKNRAKLNRRARRGLKRVSFAADCIGGDENEPGDVCGVCGGDYVDCPCPGPTQDGYEYVEIDGVLYARESAP